MELPNWVVDEVLAPAKPIAFRLTVMLYRHGRQLAGTDGSRRVYWRGSTSSLARLIGASKRATLEAEAELSALGFLRVHQTTRPNAPHAVSVPYDPPGAAEGGDNLSPPLEAENATHDDPDLSPGEGESDRDHHHTHAARVTICHRLEELGVAKNTARAWLARFGPERCSTALEATIARSGTLMNPAGFCYHLLTSRQPLKPRPKGDDDAAARRARYADDQIAEAHRRYREQMAGTER